ncbi:hypothetical protein DFH11DRAFT_1699623, partial [Phellopilus nigrolimitatus]
MPSSDPLSKTVEGASAPSLYSIAPVISKDGNVEASETKVTFFPPLHAARCAWILSILRRERVTSVLDIGCGEGALLRCLCNPAAFLLRGEPAVDGSADAAPRPALSPQASGRAAGVGDPPDLHVARLAGLDVSAPDLAACADATAPRAASCKLGLPRWEPLEVTLWHGSLAVYNAEFAGVECIVSTEVIEHLPPAVLSSFAPTLLGLYRPRLLLLTTPNFTFNARFSAPGTADPAGHPDPTRRTARVFRHHDHQFEWTVAEFAAWCRGAADAWGYEVDVDGIGVPMEDDPWKRDGELGKATQVALFRRKEPRPFQEPATLTAENAQRTEQGAHRLITTHRHVAHPQTHSPQAIANIQVLISDYMESYYFDDGYSVWDLWTADVISTACGGYLDVLIEAIEISSDLCLERLTGVPMTEWRVRFGGNRHREAVEAQRRKRTWETEQPEGPLSASSTQDDSKQG